MIPCRTERSAYRRPGNGPGRRWRGRSAAGRVLPPLERGEDRTLVSTVTSLLDNGMPGTLRYGIAAASSGETIDFDPDLSGTIRLSRGELVVDKSLTIEGPGADRLAISGHRSDRIFHVAAGGVDVV